MQDKWEQRLKNAYNDYAKARGKPSRSIKLPNGISFAGDGELAELLLRAGITTNMQDNAAAFEGWSLALRRWCNVDVLLRWTPPAVDASTSQRRHYERFLYRAVRFQNLFDWFRIDSDCADEVGKARALEGKELFLNVGGARGTEPESAAAGDSESALEHRLLTNCDFAAHYEFAQGTRDRQLPVGLFCGTVSRDSQIFPGGKGAIDLVCLNGDTLWLFELKAGENIPVGALTELFFYTSVIRDALCGGPFKFAQAHLEARLQPEALSRVSRIEGVVLGHDVHPLIHSGLISIMNAAVEKGWNAEPSRARVHFRADRIIEEAELKIAPVD